MSAIKSMYVIETYSIYSHGKFIMKYSDNPILAAIFGAIGANSDVVLFNNNPERPTESWTDMQLMSAFLQLNLVKDQAAIKPLMEWADAIGAKGVYSSPDLEQGGDRAILLMQKKIANVLSNVVLPAQAKNFNQDIKSFMGMAAMDPREFREYLLVRGPIMDLLINNEKTDSFNFPIKEKTRMVLPVGTQGLMYAFGPDGKITFPEVDQVLNGEGGPYYALFKKYNNDKFDKPDIANYIERDLKNTGDSKIKSFTLEQKTLIRDEYKKIMREFCDKNYDQLKSGSSDILFQSKLTVFLALYGGVTGYKDYILKKVIGPNAFVNMTIEEQVESVMIKLERKE
jgi:hypothetical protein